MAEYLAIPPAKAIRGRIMAPSSKSATNRALLLAALSPTPVTIVRPLESADTEALASCLEALGASIERRSGQWRVSGPLGVPGETETRLDAGDSGTAARFLAAAACAARGRFLLTGSPRLRERPMAELVAALRALGARIDHAERDGFLPLRIGGGTLRSGAVSVDASRSSQFLSALLLIGAAVPGGLEVRASGTIVSEPYVATTLDALAAFGHEVRGGPVYRVAGGSRVPPSYEVPGDWSAAIPLLAAPGVTGGEVTVSGLRFPSPDADARALPVLEELGLTVSAADGSVSASWDPRARTTVSVRATDFPDAVPPLAVLASLAAGESRFSGIGHLRLKESDRIQALAALLSAAGATVRTEEDSLAVVGPLPGGARGAVALPTSRDHRMAIAASLVSLGRPGFLVEDPGCVAKSWPGFFRDLETIVVRR